MNVSNPAEVKGTITSYTVYSLHGTDGSGIYFITKGSLRLKEDTVTLIVCER